MNSKTTYTADLFSGCGGLSLGLTRAGLKVCVGVDVDPRVKETYSTNHPDAKFLLKDIRQVSGIELLRPA